MFYKRSLEKDKVLGNNNNEKQKHVKIVSHESRRFIHSQDIMEYTKLLQTRNSSSRPTSAVPQLQAKNHVCYV